MCLVPAKNSTELLAIVGGSNNTGVWRRRLQPPEANECSEAFGR